MTTCAHTITHTSQEKGSILSCRRASSAMTGGGRTSGLQMCVSHPINALAKAQG